MPQLTCAAVDYEIDGARQIFSEFTLTIQTGEITVLLGESGTGKTTLGLLCAGGITPDSGEITIDGTPLEQSEWRPGFLRQNPENQIFGTTVERDVAFGLENRNMARQQMREKVTEALRLFRLESIREKSTADLSGGEKQRTALAGLFAMDHSYFILDEPTSYLDYPSQWDLYHQLELLRDQGFGVLWITQYPEEAVLGDRVVHLGNNEILHDTDPNDYPDVRESLEVQETINENSDKTNESLFSVKNGEFSYPDWEAENSFVMTIPDYSLFRNSCQGWYGYSGAGKSTFAKLIAGLEEFEGGSTESKLAKDDIVYVPQFAEQMLHSGTLGETTNLLRHRPGFDEVKFHEILTQEFTAFGIEPDAPFERPVWSYSGGEQRRIVLAIALALQPTLLILDEPTIGVSPGDRKKLDHIFTSREIPAIICISHEYEFLKRHTEQVIYFQNGKVMSPQSWDSLEAEFSSQNFLYKKPIPDTFHQVTS